ncbi:RagB/SusD family nutrient uptake outer membrane protein, partial [Flavitalea sp.]|nr:RagB/SusD family nutrient uptake outer membrane protein [Flavitalea sp.]
TTVFTAGDFATSTALINAILKERRIELIGEGIRNLDIMRLGLNLPARPGKAETKPGESGYILPISNNELIFNTLMTDN